MSACSYIDIAAISNNPAPGELDIGEPVTDNYDVQGNLIVGTITPGSTVTAATIQLDRAANLELKILAKAQDRANEIHSQWVNNYLACELETLSEVTNRPKASVNVAAIAASALSSADTAYAYAAQSDASTQSAMCITIECGSATRLAVSRVRSASWQIQGDLRHEEARVELFNKQRTNDRIAMIAPGRGGLVSAAASMASAARIYGELAAQAAAAKGADGYAFGRVLEFAKNNIGSLAKLFGQPQPYQSNGGQPMYGPTPTIPTPEYLDNGSGYLYDDPDLLFSTPAVATETSSIPPETLLALEQFYQ